MTRLLLSPITGTLMLIAFGLTWFIKATIQDKVWQWK